MIKTRIIGLICMMLSLLSFKSLDATHLVGGSLTYKYLGSSGSEDRYQVTLYVYRDCTRRPNGDDAVPFDDVINVCVFDNTGSYRNRGKITMDLIYDRPVDPVGNTDCPELANACLNQGKYSETITLPKSNFGYILKWERCCRNTQNNLSQGAQPDQGQTYTGIIPASALKNSSPEFTQVPVPFICANDTTSIRNFAIDPDGDSLSFRFVTPYQGANTSVSIQDNCPTFMDPFVDVNYRAGFSAASPFGFNGVAEINSTNGLTTYMSNSTGRFAVAIEVTEWRNGVAISRIRLDLQILVISCKPNNKPTLSNTSNNSEKWYIEAGANFCTNVVGKDVDAGQFVSLKGFGDIFTGANNHQGSRATYSPNPATGLNTATGQFCWQTECSQARTQPYLVTFEVVDDGCPSKFINKNVEIYIEKFDPKDAPTGPTNVCQFSTNNYTILFPTAGAKYKWQIAGGVINGSDSGSTVNVTWGNGSVGSLTLAVRSRYNCPGPNTDLIVNLIKAPNTPQITGRDTVCLNGSSTFNASADAGTTFTWKVNKGTITAGGTTNSNSATVNWNSLGKGWISVFVTNNVGCPSTIDTHFVEVIFPDSANIVGPNSVCPNNDSIAYNVQNAKSGYVYNWVITGGTLRAGQGKPNVLIDWGSRGLGTVTVTTTNTFGCVGNPVTYNVLKDHALKGQFPKGDTLLCENALNVPYNILKVNGEDYEWQITGNGILKSGQGTNSVLVDWGRASTAYISVQSTSYDSVDMLPCSSPFNEIKVELKPYPTAKPIIGEYELCQRQGIGNYSVAGFAPSNYNWEVIQLPFTGQGNSNIGINLDTFGSFTIRVKETTEFGCAGPWNDTNIVIHPKPRTTPILGPDVVCFPNYENRRYQVSGFSGSVFNWNIIEGNFFGKTDTNVVFADWNGNPNGKISVQEISEFGCVGNLLSIDVFKDNPSIEAENLTVNPPPNSDKQVLFDFKLLNAPRYDNSIIIQRRTRGSAGAYLNIQAIAGNQTNYVDQTALTDSLSYQYRAVGINLCGDSIYSNSMTDILLKGRRPTPFEGEISFTDFTGWDNGVDKYELYRALENKTGYELYRTYNAPTTEVFKNGTDHYGQWYRVKAYELGGSRVSWSNDVVIYFEPIIYIPNVFSPTKDGLNDKFKPSNSGLKKYELSIKNRWGELIFKTEDPDNAWDGTYMGKDAPIGVYVYYVKYEDFRDKKYNTKGTLHLLR